jgi:CheY-like chemotaxis protein
MKSGPIILIEDDEDDQGIMEDVMNELKVPNKLIWFDRCSKAMQYLLTTTDQPFIILCDVNMPEQNGIEFKRQVDNDPYLRNKSIPFVFYSTSVQQDAVNEAYTKMTVQGYFKKRNSFEEIKKIMRLILDYWYECRHPNSA